MPHRARVAVLVPVLLLFPLAGCQTAGQTAGAIVAGTAIGGVTPSNGLEQIYYLGVFDPREQIPQAFYRVTVRGQASAINLQTRFASGWVPAALIDGLGTDIDAKLKTGGGITATGEGTTVPELNDPVKRMFMVGPEGIRVSPARNRLAIVMGSSPEAFFAAVDNALGTLSAVAVSENDARAKDSIVAEYRRLQEEAAAVGDLRLKLANAALKRAAGSSK